MSLVYITFHDENIYEIEKPKEIEPPKPQSYVSIHKKKVAKEFENPSVVTLKDGSKLLTGSKKSARKTMGYAETPLDPPCAYLKKNQGVKWRRQNEHVCIKSDRMPPVPRYDREKHRKETKVIEKIPQNANPNCPHRFYFRGHKHRLDFVKLNANIWRKAKTKHPPPRYVDTPKGETHTILNTGLIPQYICAKDFGKVPCYLMRHKQILARTRAECAEVIREEELACKQRYGVRKMQTDEREKLLTGLRQNYAESMKTYQSLPLHTDTQPKRIRKAYLENLLRQLELDIQLLTSNDDIYVAIENV